MRETIFNLSLTDEYINNLNEEDTHYLIYEVESFTIEMEKEISSIVWGHEAPESALKPSQISWDPDLYQEEIAANPSFRAKLDTAQEMSTQIGIALAIKATAYIHLDKLSEKEHDE